MNSSDAHRVLRGWKLAWPELIVLLAVAGLLVYQLFVPPIVGMADNGDFDRVLEPLGLRPVATEWGDRYFLYVNQEYRTRPRAELLLPSSEALLGEIAVRLNALFVRDGSFHLAAICAVHFVLYLLGLYLILLASQTLRGPPRAAVGLLLLLAGADVAYVATFNSFYTESPSLIFLAVLLGVALLAVRRATPARGLLVAYFAAAALLVAAKPQNYALAVPLVLFPLALLARAEWRLCARWAVVLSCALVLWGGWLFVNVPHIIRSPVLWDTVFFSILRDSPDPAHDLRQFGLDPGLARFRGIPAWAGDVATPHFEVTRHYGFGDVARFYLRHPGRAARVGGYAARHAFLWRDPLIGNFTRASGIPPRTLSAAVAGWSDMQRRLFPRSPAFLLAFFAAFMVAAARELRRAGLGTPAGSLAVLCLVVALTALLEFGVTAAVSGLRDIIKHLYLFQLLFDVCLIATVAWGAGRLASALPWGWWRSVAVEEELTTRGRG